MARDALGKISRELVSLHKRFYGKGPLSAKTFLVNDSVLCMHEGGFTAVERTLIELGRAASVHELRASFQAAMREPFTRVVEQALDRKVRAYMTQVHTDPDIAVELFILEPVVDQARAEYGYQPADAPRGREGVEGGDRDTPAG